MTRPKPKHLPCPCGCGELADECMNPNRATNLGAFALEEPIGTRPGWSANNYEASVLLPAATDERADYLAQLDREAEHGPADDPHDPQNVSRR